MAARYIKNEKKEYYLVPFIFVRFLRYTAYGLSSNTGKIVLVCVQGVERRSPFLHILFLPYAMCAN